MKKRRQKKPVWSQQANTGGSIVEVSVWLNQIELDNEETIEVSMHRSYKKGENWEQTQSLRPLDVLAAAHLLSQA